MKKVLTLILLVITIGTLYSQQIKKNTISQLKNEYSESDSVPKVIYGHTGAKMYENSSRKKQPVYIIDGKCITELSKLNALDPNDIDSFYVEKKDTTINNQNYYGKILIKTKRNNFQSSIITVSDLVSKYTNLKNKHYLFTIDGKINYDDKNKTYVDEKRIMIVNCVKLDKAFLPYELWVVNILTRTAENIKEANGENAIRLRGSELDMKN